LANFESETVGAQVNGGVKGLGLHAENVFGEKDSDYVTVV
jgi:hypothetical protein